MLADTLYEISKYSNDDYSTLDLYVQNGTLFLQGQLEKQFIQRPPSWHKWKSDTQGSIVGILVDNAINKKQTEIDIFLPVSPDWPLTFSWASEIIGWLKTNGLSVEIIEGVECNHVLRPEVIRVKNL